MLKSKAKCASRREQTTGLLAHDQHFRDVREQFAAGGAIDRLPSERVGVDRLDHVGHRRLAAVGQYALVVDVPAILLERPCRFGVAAVGIERPRANRFRGRIPTDDLHAG